MRDEAFDLEWRPGRAGPQRRTAVQRLRKRPGPQTTRTCRERLGLRRHGAGIAWASDRAAGPAGPTEQSLRGDGVVTETRPSSH